MLGETVFFYWKGRIRYRRLREILDSEEGPVANFTERCGETEKIWIPIEEVFHTKEELLEFLERNK